MEIDDTFNALRRQPFEVVFREYMRSPLPLYTEAPIAEWLKERYWGYTEFYDEYNRNGNPGD